MTGRLIVGISGASGVVYGVRLLEALRGSDVETHLVMSRSARLTLAYELPLKAADVEALAAVNHRQEDIGAAIASGSFRTMGMIVAPCSIRTLVRDRDRRHVDAADARRRRGAEGAAAAGAAGARDAAAPRSPAQHDGRSPKWGRS